MHYQHQVLSLKLNFQKTREAHRRGFFPKSPTDASLDSGKCKVSSRRKSCMVFSEILDQDRRISHNPISVLKGLYQNKWGDGEEDSETEQRLPIMDTMMGASDHVEQ